MLLQHVQARPEEAVRGQAVEAGGHGRRAQQAGPVREAQVLPPQSNLQPRVQVVLK